MAFMRVNGYEIQVSATTKAVQQEVEIGNRNRGFGGAPSFQRRGIFRKWKGSTCKLSESDALAHAGAIQGKGEVWGFDAGLYSLSGLPPIDGTAANRRPGTAEDGRDIYYTVTPIPREARYGTHSLAPEPSFTNLLSSDSADAENAPTGYNAVGGGSLSANTTRYVQGSRSVRIASGAAGAGVTTDTVGSIGASTDYTASVYVYSDGSNDTVIMSLIENGSTVLATDGVLFGTPATFPGGRWYRLEATGTTGGSPTTLEIQVVNQNGNDHTYCDGFQLETGDKAHTWVDGGVTSPAANLKYQGLKFSDSVTLSFWARGDVSSSVGSTGLLGLRSNVAGSSLLNRVTLFQNSGTDDLRGSFVDSTGSFNNLLLKANLFDSPDWHHIGVVYDRIASVVMVVVDGVTETTQDVTVDVDLSDPALGIELGRLATGPWFVGLIDDVVITPYAMTTSQVQALYNMGKAMSPLPRYYIDGDITRDPELTTLATGRATEFSYASVDLMGAGIDEKNREVQFDIDEWGRE